MSQPPAAIGRHRRAPFVGRTAEIAALRERLATAREGVGGVVLIAGEPGIGKTRLVTELSEQARLDGWTVRTGRAVQADGLPPYLPFVEALRDHVRATPAETLRAQLGAGACDVALLVREIDSLLPEAAPASGAHAETERYRLFESIAEFLLAVARGGGGREPGPPDGGAPVTPAPTGLLLVLDDLHWADVSTLQLLLHLSRRLASQPLLVVGTYRDLEVQRGHPLSDVLAELVRAGVSDQLTLRGLDRAEVGTFIELATGVDVTAGLISGVHKETEGNPLFVVELVRLLQAEGRLQGRPTDVWHLTIPQSVQQVIGRRLDRLSDSCKRMLTLAAVIGREFSLLTLEQAGDVSGDAMLEALEEAESARVIAAVPHTPGRYAFTHPLIRETLYGQILTARRVRLHRTVGETLERLYVANPDAHLDELAHHFFQAAPGGDVAKAVAYAGRAADRAMALLAYEDAARLYTSALQAHALAQSDEAARCRLLLSLGEAQTRAGETATGKETFRRAAELAAGLSLPALQARAALGYGGYRGQPGAIDRVFVELAEAALASLVGALAPDDQAVRARLLARLAMELYHAHEFERCVALSREGVELARRGGDNAALAATLVGRHYATHTPDNLDERLAITAELVRLAEAVGDREVALQGYYLRTIDALEAGDASLTDASIDAHDRLSTELRQPLYQWRTLLLRATQAMVEARVADGQRLAQQAFAVASVAQIANGPTSYGTQMLALALLTGTGLEAMEAPWRSFAERFPLMLAYRSGLILVQAYLDRETETRREFEIAAANDFVDMPRDDNFLPTLCSFCEVASSLGDRPRAAALYAMGRPYADRVGVVNAATAVRGPIAMHLGALAGLLSQWDAAEAYFREASAIAARLRARHFELETQYYRAEMLLRRSGPGDATTADALLAEIVPAAQALGLARLNARASRLLRRGADPGAGLGSAPEPVFPDGLTEREVEVLRLLAVGSTNREIADSLVLSTRTVDHHIANIYRKINARRRADAAAYAQRIGLASSEPSAH